MFLFGGLLRRAVVLVVLLAVAGGAAWWFFVRSDASIKTAAPAIPANVASTSSSGSDPNSQKFVIVPQISGISDATQAAYFANEKLASLPLPSTAEGTTTNVQGEIHLTPTGLDPSQPTKITIDLKSLKSDQSQRDGQVQRYLQTSQYPTATFTATKLTGFPATFTPGQAAQMQLTGTLDVHGIQKEVTWDVRANKSGNVLTGLATLKVNFGDFGLQVPNIAGIVSVQDGLTLQVTIVAQAA
jgi:polyisoprenoid-binding protein YceI